MRARGVAPRTSRTGIVSATADYANTVAFVSRARGALLRLVRRRRASALTGLALVIPSAWVEFGGRDVEWWVEGLALVCGAIGVALLWSGIGGVPPDWTDPGE